MSNFSIKTKSSGLTGFSETSPESGLYSRTGTARRGKFTVIQLQAGGETNGQPDLSVQSNGNDDESDRQKGLILTADNRTELTVYALRGGSFSTIGAHFMAINCVEFPTARDYQYFVFSSDDDESLFLITPCQDNTTIHVRPSQPYTHPSWVNPSVQRTTPGTLEDEAIYGRRFNRFDTLMLSSFDDLTGTIVTSDKPLSVFSGFANHDTYIEQIPPHPTYGNRFFLQPHEFMVSRVRIGSVSDEASIQVNCPCEPGSVTINRLPLSGSGRFFTVVINRGQYVECRTYSFVLCSVQSTRPVSVMTVYDSFIPNLMVYIPPVDSYLTRYSLISLDDSSVFLSYTLQDLNSPGLLVNGNVLPPFFGFTTVDCRLDCSESMVCGRGTTDLLEGTSDIQFSGNVQFWGYFYSYNTFAYPLPFEMKPIGCKFYTQ